MKKEKNIFLTTLSETSDRLNVNYFMCETPTGTHAYTTGISATEAGIKYVLSMYEIDEIIVTGPSDRAESDAEYSAVLEDAETDSVADYDNMREFDFLIYRIQEFMQQIDFELLDISEPVSFQRQKEINGLLDKFKSAYANGIGYRELFAKLTMDPYFAERFKEEILGELTKAEEKWVRYSIFHEMDSFYKMHMLEENKKTIIRYVPIPMDITLSAESIDAIVSRTLQEKKCDVNLYMDIQGMAAIDGNTLISTFMLMNKKIGYTCSVKGLIDSCKSPEKLFGQVSNVIESYKIQKLITGLEIFLRYGKADELKNYWDSIEISDPDADRIFYGIGCVDEGVTLCNVDLIACGINVIKKAIRFPKTNPATRNIYMRIIINAITNDYGSLLSGDELSIPELLKWSLRKGLYQQTLTIIESKVPEDMVKRGIYYYASSEKDIEPLMKEFNFLYWNESSKMRWAFSDIEHYFIKSYGRSVLDFRQKPDLVIRDYARLRIEALHGEVKEILPAYSELNNDDLLYEVLLGYYRIGNLRNQVNHAIIEEPDMDSDDFSERKDSRLELYEELKKFISLYSTACKKTVTDVSPCILSSGRMKAYSRRHVLKPLEETTDLTAKNTYSCSFNGKEVRIDISLFKPEPDAEPESDIAAEDK